MIDMREIKFRAWDKKNNCWVDPQYSIYPEYMLGGFIDMHIGAGIELMQYTGLKDKNGKEIYEGDILDVKFRGGYVERISWKGPPDARAFVFWDFSAFRLKCKGAQDERYADWTDTDGYFDPMLEMERSHSEVIGNIYENPELLENEKAS